MGLYYLTEDSEIMVDKGVREKTFFYTGLPLTLRDSLVDFWSTLLPSPPCFVLDMDKPFPQFPRMPTPT